MICFGFITHFFFFFFFLPNSVPAIPSLSEVACISVDRTGSCKEKLLDYISKECRVVGKAPVYIADVIERPGALLVKWSEVRLITGFYNKFPSPFMQSPSFQFVYL